MTLDEAIAISDEIGKGDTERAANNRWLAEQLRVLKLVEDCHIIDEARRAREEMHGWQSEYAKLRAENAKLRELLRDAYRYINRPADASWTHMSRREARDSINGRVSEMGIEVDG